MKYRSNRGTVINIPDGLDPKQIAAIKADADAGYGKRAQETANTLLKKGGGKKTPGAGGGGGLSDAVNPTTGVVDPQKAADEIARKEQEDIDANFKLNQPKTITDQFGNKRVITRDPTTGEVTITDELGGTAKKFKDLAEAAAGTFNGDVSRQKAQEATYGTLTKYYDRDQAREMEDAKQELANRGIPYDPAAAQDVNSKNLYGRTIGGIGQKYQGLKDAASQQAVISGNQAYATDSAARDSFLKAVNEGANTFSGNFQPYSNNIQTDQSGAEQDLLTLSAEQYMRKYAIDQDTYFKKKALAKSGSGGGGGGAKSGGSAPAGFEIVG